MGFLATLTIDWTDIYSLYLYNISKHQTTKIRIRWTYIAM